MTTTRSIGLLVALVIGLTIAPLASGAVVSPLTGAQTGQSDGSGTETTNASVGTLMQASAADTESAVESGMFEAAYETADNESREAIVADRTARLADRLAQLRTERDELRDQRDTLTPDAYRSRMATLTVEIAALERSIDRTERRAADVGVGGDRLAALKGNATAIRQNASAEAGPGTAAVARGLADADGPAGPGAGPVDDGGPPTDAGPGNGPDAGNNSETGPGESAGNGPSNESPGERPSDPGPPTEKSEDGSSTGD